MRDPLLLPLVAVVGGVLIDRAIPFSGSESMLATAIFAALALAAGFGAKRVRWLPLGLALVFAGVFLDACHRPGPAPTIDAGSKETVILEGCVVEPTVFSPDR